MVVYKMPKGENDKPIDKHRIPGGATNSTQTTIDWVNN